MSTPHLTYNGVRVSFGGSTLSYGDPLNPLGLPPYTVRVKFKSGYSPSSQTDVTHTLVDATENIWDYYKYQNSNTFNGLLRNDVNLLEVLGANTSGVTDMSYMFANCSALTTVPVFDTSSVTTTSYMFNNCTSLTTVPLFDTSSLVIMARMFYYCTAVESGALALYTQASTQATPPTNHSYTFKNCGINTTTGAAELAQIPSNWGGTMS